MRRVGVGAEKPPRNGTDGKLKKENRELRAENEQLKTENEKLKTENEKLKRAEQ